MLKIDKKRADLTTPIVIFLVLNIAFFSMMMIFVQRVSSNVLVYEEAYAKDIGLILNRAESGMTIYLDITNLVEIAIKNDLELKDLESLITIDVEKGVIVVKAKKEGGFEFPYFSKVLLEKPNGEIFLEEKDNKITKAKYRLVIK